MAATPPHEYPDEHAFLDTVEGEITFFRSLMRARPVGRHRFFHLLAIANAINRDTGKILHHETIWEKLRQCYDLEALDGIDIEADGYVSSTSKLHNSTPISIRSPSPSENLAAHPFFREEFNLPWEDFESIISQRRLRASASAPSSPAASPAAGPPVSSSSTQPPPPIPSTSSSTSTSKKGASTRKRPKTTKSKLNLAGLVGGDSDSSALTQESGDEGVPETPRESVVTGTDAGTEYGDDEDAEMREPSPAQEASPKPGRGRSTKNARRGRTSTASRGTAASRKKRKR